MRPPAAPVFLAALLALQVAVSSVHGSSPGPSRQVIRVRLPNGLTQRVESKAEDTILDIKRKAFAAAAAGQKAGAKAKSSARKTEKAADDAELFRKPSDNEPLGDGVAVRELGLDHGAILYCRPAIKASGDSSAFDQRAKQMPGQSVRNWEDLSKEQSQLRVQHQSKPTVSKLSLDASTTRRFAAYLSRRSEPTRRVALLFGETRTNEKQDQEVLVHAMWEPPQLSATPSDYDVSTLQKAVKGCPAISLAKSLGYELVGWLFTHPPRDHFLSSSDVLLTSEMKQSIEQDRGVNASSSFVIVAVRDGVVEGASAKDAEQVSFEAYQVSHQVFRWTQDGTIRPLEDHVSQSHAARLQSTKELIAEGKHTREFDTALCSVPVPIVAHEGPLRSLFTPANRPEEKQSKRLLRRALFGTIGEPLGLEERLTDFQLLLYLSKRVPDLGPLIQSIKSGAPIPTYYKTVFEQLTGTS